MAKRETEQLMSLFARLLLFVLSAYVALFLVGLIFDHCTDWRLWCDPRARLLWDDKPDGSRIVLLGDSVFCSYYVSTPERMLHSRLAALAGETVFSGALNGAKWRDLLAACRIVGEHWPPGTIVFIDMTPTRPFDRRCSAEPESNYKSALESIVRDDASDLDGLLRNHLVFPGANSLFLLRNQHAVKRYVVHLAGRDPVFFNTSPEGNFVWYRDHGFAARRYEVFEHLFAKMGDFDGFGGLSELSTSLQTAGIGVVFVLTPFNADLVRRFAKNVPADVVLTRLDRVHSNLVRFLDRSNYEYLDLFHAVPSDGFVDLMHTNEKGDELMATHMAQRIREHRVEGRLARTTAPTTPIQTTPAPAYQ